ncbi:MAG TPA: histidine kinase, partial [bacterium]|nr:histidine kinase [bacterium]
MFPSILSGYALSLLCAGVFLAAAVFSFALFLGGGRQRPHLLFGLHQLTCVGGIAIEFPEIRVWTRLPDAWKHDLDSFFLISGGVLLIAFFAQMFELPRRRLHYAAAVPAALLPGLTAGVYATIYTVLAYVSALLVWAVARRRPGGVPALGGVLILAAGTGMTHVRLPGAVAWNALGLVLFIFSVAIATSRQLRWQNRRHEKERLQAARLEGDLLKRVIQPHFLMNTLLSILSWMRKDPATAAKLVQALAEEFRAISAVASRRTIGLDVEVELCRGHLKLMGYRNDASYRLETGPLPESASIPPLVLHTLVENGLTHAFAPGEPGVFRLSCQAVNGATRLRLANGGSRLDRLEARGRDAVEEGLGLRYVRA